MKTSKYESILLSAGYTNRVYTYHLMTEFIHLEEFDKLEDWKILHLMNFVFNVILKQELDFSGWRDIIGGKPPSDNLKCFISGNYRFQFNIENFDVKLKEFIEALFYFRFDYSYRTPTRKKEYHQHYDYVNASSRIIKVHVYYNQWLDFHEKYKSLEDYLSSKARHHIKC